MGTADNFKIKKSLLAITQKNIQESRAKYAKWQRTLRKARKPGIKALNLVFRYLLCLSITMNYGKTA